MFFVHGWIGMLTVVSLIGSEQSGKPSHDAAGAEGIAGPLIVASEPLDGAVDAGIPHAVDGSSIAFGWDTVDIRFGGDVPGLTPEDFDIIEHGGNGVPPAIAHVTVRFSDVVRLVLTEPIEPGAWTVITHRRSGTSVRLGYLPGDVNGDGVAGPADILAAVNNLNGVYDPPLEMWQCDIDRDGACDEADVQALNDLLKGSARMEAWLGARLPSVPLPNSTASGAGGATANFVLQTSGNMGTAIVKHADSGAASPASAALGGSSVTADTARTERTSEVFVRASEPLDGAVDAGIPHAVDGSSIAFGWDTVDLRFSGDASGLTAEDFDVTERGGDGVAPTIAQVAAQSSDLVRLVLTEPIEPGAWTVITHRGSGTSIRLGYLPGDVDGDGVAGPADILSAVNNLNGVYDPPLDVWQCDIDRNGTCEEADLRALNELLKGSARMEAWLGARLPGAPLRGSTTSGAGGAAIRLLPSATCPSPGSTITVDVLVEQSPPGIVRFLRLLQFDFSASDPALTLNSFAFKYDAQEICQMVPALCGNLYTEFVRLDDLDGKVVSTVFTGTSQDPLNQIRLPKDPENPAIKVGVLELTVPTTPGTYTLDALNAGAPDRNTGARIDFGFGGADPQTTWWSGDCTITGGVIELAVVPYTIGGAIYTACDDPLLTGVANVEVCADCAGGFHACTRTVESQGLWQIDNVPCGPCTVTPRDESGTDFCHVTADCPPDTCAVFAAIEVNEANQAVNESIQFLLRTCSILSSNPPNCAIDARKPSKPDGSNPAGWNAVELTFNEECNTSALAPGDFNVTVTPAGTPPDIADVTATGQVVTIHLASIIPTGKWTCVEYNGSGDQVCLGFLPADVSGDRTSSAADILYLIDILNGVRPKPWGDASCDIDRSGICNPADILRLIDLLNGADAYDQWLGQTLSVCPSAP